MVKYDIIVLLLIDDADTVSLFVCSLCLRTVRRWRMIIGC